MRLFHNMYNSHNAVRKAFKKAGLKHRDRAFIQELILGKRFDTSLGGPELDDLPTADATWDKVGRTADKRFLYDVSDDLVGVNCIIL